MRCLCYPLLIASVLSTIARAAGPDPEHDEELRDPQRIVFQGIEAFDIAQVRKQLVCDIDVQAAAHPRKPLSKFVKTLEETVEAGYRHSGFPDATIKVGFDDRLRQVVVHVDEGQRYRCGGVRVEGIEGPLLQELTKALTEEFCPPDVISIVTRQPDGIETTDWETTTGKPAELPQPAWKTGEPAAIDVANGVILRRQIRGFFLARGFCIPEYKLAYSRDSESNTIVLIVVVKDIGRNATVSDINIEGAESNTAEDIRNYLGLHQGMPFTGRLRTEMERRLWESGRFIEATVGPAFLKTADVPLEITVVEHPRAPRLSEELTEEDRILLKLRNWLVRWAAGDHEDDLIFEASSAPADQTAVEPNADLAFDVRIVASPRTGEAISLAARTRDGQPVFERSVIAGEKRLALISPLNKTYFEVEHSSKIQLRGMYGLAGGKPTKDNPVGVNLNLGLFFKHRDRGYSNPFVFRALLDPVALLVQAREFDKGASHREDGRVSLRGRYYRVVIHEQTGRLEELRFEPDDGKQTIRLHTVRGALQAELKKHRQFMAASQNVYDPARGWQSLGIYILDELRRIPHFNRSRELEQSLAALHKLISIWSLEPIADSGSAVADVDVSHEEFQLPPKRVEWALPALKMFDFEGSGKVAGKLLPLYRDLTPRTGCLWPLGRDALLALMGRSPATPETICEYDQVASSGPVGHVIAAMALRPFSPQVASQLAANGLGSWSTRDFRADYAPYLSKDSWVGRNITTLAEALRQLDDSEIAALVRLLPDEPHHVQITESLLMLRAKTDRDTQVVLAEVLDRLWTCSFKSAVESVLRGLAAGEELAPPALLRTFRLMTPSDMRRSPLLP